MAAYVPFPFHGNPKAYLWNELNRIAVAISGGGITNLSPATSAVVLTPNPILGAGTIGVSANLNAYSGGDTPSAFTLSIVDSVDAPAWRAAIGAGTSSAVPGNPDRSVQINNAGVFAGSANFTYSANGNLVLAAASSGVTLTVNQSVVSQGFLLQGANNFATFAMVSNTLGGTAGAALFDASNGAGICYFGITSNGFSGSFISGAPAGAIGILGVDVAKPLVFGTNQIARLWFDGSTGAITSPVAAGWSGLHTFTHGPTSSLDGAFTLVSTSPLFSWQETDAGTDEKVWDFVASGAHLLLRTASDAGAGQHNILDVARSGAALTTISYGNPTDNPAHTFYGGLTSQGGTLSLAYTAASYCAIGTFGAGTYPGFSLFAVGAPANDRRWFYYVDETNGSYNIALASDAGAVTAVGISIIPSGGNISTLALIAAVTTLAGRIRLKGYTVGTLPAGTVGDVAYVTDALAPAFLAVLVGGGAITTKAFYNGAAWVAQ